MDKVATSFHEAGNKLVGKEKKLKNSEEKDLKSKFKTKEEYETYIQKLKSEAVMKKETYSEKEKDLKNKGKKKFFSDIKIIS